MATLSFYIRHILRDGNKIEELLDALNDPNAGVSISEEEVKRTREDLEKGKLFLSQWKKKKND